MTAFAIDPDRVDAFAAAFKACRYRPMPYGFLSDWPGDDRAAAVRAFLLFMVVIDHHTHSDTVRYEGTVRGTFYHGSELLFMTAERAKQGYPPLFSAQAMVAFDEATARTVFAADNGALPTDLAGRAHALRDLAVSLRQLSEGPDALSACKTIGGPTGLIARLTPLPGYGDPQAKKANLLAKTWMREGVWHPSDPEHLALPVDHVVMTMALRGGLLKIIDQKAHDVIVRGSILPPPLLADLRAATGPAYAAVSTAAGLPLADLDDLVWSYGRKALREDTPLSSPEQVSSELDDQVDRAGRVEWVRVINGLEATDPAGTAAIPQIRFAFTRDF